MNMGTLPEMILVEGIMGVGKSGMAQSVARMLCSAQLPYRWFFEMDRNNPVGQDNDPRLPTDTLHRSEVQWKRFVQDWTTASMALVDGRLLNINVSHSLLDGRSHKRISDELIALSEIFRGRRTLLIHLVSSDIPKRLAATLSTRNDVQWYTQRVSSSKYAAGLKESTLESALRLLEEAQAVSKEVVSVFPGETMTFDMDRTAWTDAEDAIASRLGASTEGLRVQTPRAIVVEGRYRLTMGSEETVVTIRRDDAALVIENHPFSVYGGADDPFTLLPDGNGRLVLRSAPVVLIPNRTDGVVQEFRQTSWHHGDSNTQFDGRLVRVDT